MGAGSSSDPPDIEEDELGVEYEDGQGVVKHIPIEVKPRGKLGVRPSRSSSKPKNSSSLRSALSVDVTENAEVERVYKEFEMYRMKCDNEVANMLKKEQKLETENRKLRAELQALQKMCKKQRDERDSALEAEHRALMRAAAIESDRDKIQRQFKIFRETKENELQNLLRAKRRLESKLAKLGSSALEDSETSSRIEIGFGNIGDWWTTMDNSEQTLNSAFQVHGSSSVCRGPEFAHPSCDGPYVTVRKDDWQQATANLANNCRLIHSYLPTNVIRLYISAANELQSQADTLSQNIWNKLKSVFSNDGLFIDVVSIPNPEDCDVLTEPHLSTRKWQIERCTIFVAIIAGEVCRIVEKDIDFCHTHCSPKKLAIFCSQNLPSPGDVLKKLTSSCDTLKLISDYDSMDGVAEQICSVVTEFLHHDLKSKSTDSPLSDPDGMRQSLLGCIVWDPFQESEQLEALNLAGRSMSVLGFEKYYEQLNRHVSAAGPLPPLLVCGGFGSGKSLLLAKWIEMQQYKTAASNGLLLYHFVGSRRSSSADPSLMVRRLTAQLIQHVSCPPFLPSDPRRLLEEFPKWLDKVSSRVPGGVILVIDSVDRFQKCDSELAWLVDPLPVDLRVIVSLHPDSCPAAWKSWPSLLMSELTTKNMQDLLRAKLSSYNVSLTAEQEERIISHCQSLCPSSCLCIVLIASYIARLTDLRLEQIVEPGSVVLLYKTLVEHVVAEYEHCNDIAVKVLLIVFATHHGISESELFELIPELTWSLWSPLCSVLLDFSILSYRSGLLVFAHEQARDGVAQAFLQDDKSALLTDIRCQMLNHFSNFKRPGILIHRSADEVPYLCWQLGDTEKLRQNLVNPYIFVNLYARGHCAQLMFYWQCVCTDKSSIANAYLVASKELEDSVNSSAVTLPDVADVYESVGKYMSDLGLLSESLTMHQRALEIREMSLDPDDGTIASSLHYLADLNAQQGKPMTAELLYRQAIEIYEGSLGREHPLVGKEMYTLAVLYQKQGKHELAEPLHKEALAIRQKNIQSSVMKVSTMKSPCNTQYRLLQLGDVIAGPDSVELARTLNEIGVLHYLQNDAVAAETFLKRSLQIRESLLTASHPDVAQSLNNLAALYSDLKNYHQAAQLYERALEIRQKHFPIEHQCVASLLKNLGIVYKKMGQLDKAAVYYNSMVESKERCFGAGHPAVATALVNLGVIYSQLGKLTAAEPLFERALTIYEDSLDPSHPRVSETLRNMALLKYEQGDFQMAAQLYKRSTDMRDSDSLVACEMSKVASSSSNDTRTTLCLPQRQPDVS